MWLSGSNNFCLFAILFDTAPFDVKLISGVGPGG